MQVIEKRRKVPPVESVTVEFYCEEIDQKSRITVEDQPPDDESYTGNTVGVVITGDLTSGGTYRDVYTRSDARAMLKALREYFDE